MEDKNKAKTLIERFGFQEQELTTPKHDEILLWLLNPENCIKMLEELEIIKRKECFGFQRNYWNCDWSWETKRCSGNCEYSEMSKVQAQQEANKAYENLKATPKGNDKDLISIEVEYAIMGNNNWNIGFVDAHINVKAIDIEYRGHEYNCSFYRQIFEASNDSIYVEIKPQVRSIGELIRQINFYRSHKKGSWIVITSTKDLKEILRSQDIFVYEWEKKEISP